MFAVIGKELANRLVRMGFELLETKDGRFTKVYYFRDTEELYIEIEKYLEDKR